MNKTEDKYFYQFWDYYCNLFGLKRIDFNYDNPDKNHQYKNPDYLAIHKTRKTNYLIEVKRLFDRADHEASIIYSYNARRLENQLKNQKPKTFKGVFVVEVPRNIRITMNQTKVEVDRIYEAINNNQDKTNILGKYESEIKKISDDGSGVYLSTSWGGFIDPAQTIFQNLDGKVKTANTQLGQQIVQKVEKRILLIPNHYWHASIPELIQTLSYMYDSLIDYKNIDEIWFQIWPNSKEKPIHKLVYTKEFLTSLEGKTFKKDDQNIKLFENWYTSLEKKNDNIKNQLILALKTILGMQPAYKFFTDKFTRGEMTRSGIWLIEKGRTKEAEWLIERFLDDPDPEEPRDYKGDDDFNYHKKISENRDSGIITGVKCHLSWVIQKLALKKKSIKKAFEYTKKILKTQNLYIIQQAIIPLIEITARRQWLNKKNQGELKDILFSLLEDYGRYRAIAEYLAHAFYYSKDVTNQEAQKIVTNLNDNRDLAVLLVYFAIYRKNHFPKLRKFDPKTIEEILIDKIKNGNSELRQQIAFQFRRIISDDSNQLKSLKPYLEIFLKSKQPSIYADEIIDIVKNIMEEQPKLAIEWFEKLLSNMVKYAKTKDKKTPPESVGFFDIEKIFKIIAEKEPRRLVEDIIKIKELWWFGAQIFGLKNIFESYQFVQDKKLKEKIIKELKKIYQIMKKENPKFVAVDWSL